MRAARRAPLPCPRAHSARTDTAYGGFKASLWTDNVQAIVIMIFIIIGGAAIGTRIEISQERIDSSGLLTANRFGGQLFFILPAAIIFSQMFNQGAWRRALASCRR